MEKVNGIWRKMMVKELSVLYSVDTHDDILDLLRSDKYRKIAEKEFNAWAEEEKKTISDHPKKPDDEILELLETNKFKKIAEDEFERWAKEEEKELSQHGEKWKK